MSTKVDRILRARVTFFFLLLNFILILIPMFTPYHPGKFFLVLIFSFFVLGVLLKRFSEVAGVTKREIRAYKITAVSSVSFFIFAILHNAFYAFGILTSDFKILSFVINAIGTLFFLIAVLVSPLGFLYGSAIGICELLKNRRKSANN